MKILIEYYFVIEHAKGSENLKANTLSRKSKLQSDKEVIGAIIKKDIDGKIKYNYPQLAATYKAPISTLKAKIKEVQENSSEEYIRENYMFIPEEVTKEFITEFHKGIT